MTENVISFNVPNLLTVGVMVLIFSVISGLVIKMYQARSNVA